MTGRREGWSSSGVGVVLNVVTVVKKISDRYCRRSATVLIENDECAERIFLERSPSTATYCITLTNSSSEASPNSRLRYRYSIGKRQAESPTSTVYTCIGYVPYPPTRLQHIQTKNTATNIEPKAQSATQKSIRKFHMPSQVGKPMKNDLMYTCVYMTTTPPPSEKKQKDVPSSCARLKESATKTKQPRALCFCEC